MGKSKIVRRKAKRRRDIKRKQRPDPNDLALPDYGSKPTEERLSKVDPEFVVTEPTEYAGTNVTRVRVQDSFDFYYQRVWLANKHIGEGEAENQRRYDAGMELREYFRRAKLPSRVISNYSDMIAGWSAESYANGSMDARKKFFIAAQAIDANLWWTLRDCAVEGKPVGPHGMDRLRIGLEQLCVHLGR